MTAAYLRLPIMQCSTDKTAREPEEGISNYKIIQDHIIKEYHSDDCLDYAKSTGSPWNHLSDDCQSSASQNTF